MKNKTVVATITAMIMSTGGIVFAQGKSDHDDRRAIATTAVTRISHSVTVIRTGATIRATLSRHSVATSAAQARATVTIVAIGSRPNTAIASTSSMTGAAIV